MRGINLLKVGGRMVYSTCSMNPVENEAVVAEVLRRCGQSVELLDVSTELPQLVRRPGLKTWKVRDKGLWLASYKDASKYRRGAIFPSMFPSGRGGNSDMTATSDVQEDMGLPVQNESVVDSEHGLVQHENSSTPTNIPDEEVSSLPLERCMRILPHDQNTGAFFIAVFQKLSSLPVLLEENSKLNGLSTRRDSELPKLYGKIREVVNELEINPSEDDVNTQKPVLAEAKDADLLDKQSVGSEKNEENEVDGEIGQETGGKKRLQIQGKWRGVDPVVIFEDDGVINSIRGFYGISESFALSGQLVTRNSDGQRVKRIYYVSKSVQDVLKLNIQAGQRLKITSVGLKIFERQTSQEGHASACLYRISSEGLPLLLPYVSKQILGASLADFTHLLQYRSIKFGDFVDAKFGESASELMLGCCVIVLNNKKGGDDEAVSGLPIQVDASTIAVGCWKGKTNMSVMVSSADSQELLARLSVRLQNEDKLLTSHSQTPA